MFLFFMHPHPWVWPIRSWTWVSNICGGLTFQVKETYKLQKENCKTGQVNQSGIQSVQKKKKIIIKIRIMLSKIKIMDSPIKAPTSNQIQNKNATSRISWLSYCSSNHIRPIILVNLISRALLAHIELPSIQLL